MTNSKSKTRPRGRNMSPRTNVKCGRAIVRFIDYYNGDSDTEPTEEQYADVQAFKKNMQERLNGEERRRRLQGERRREQELKKLVEEQAAEMEKEG